MFKILNKSSKVLHAHPQNGPNQDQCLAIKMIQLDMDESTGELQDSNYNHQLLTEILILKELEKSGAKRAIRMVSPPEAYEFFSFSFLFKKAEILAPFFGIFRCFCVLTLLDGIVGEWRCFWNLDIKAWTVNGQQSTNKFFSQTH